MSTDALVSALTADYLLRLRNNGYGVIPFRAYTKAPPPGGLTGDDGTDLEPPEIEAAFIAGRFGNVGVRLPRGVVGLDVDAYDDKHGGETWRGLHAIAESASTPIPDTVRITARADHDAVSGIRLYRAALPTEREWRTGLKGLEVLRHGHRYAMCPPSMHPTIGRPYEAIMEGTGELLDILPPVRDLPLLPAAVIMELTQPGPVKRTAGDPVHVNEITGDTARGYGEPCKPVRERATRARTDLTGAESRHDTMTGGVFALARLHEQGHTGALGALNDLRGTFVHAVVTGGGMIRSSAEAEAEYDRAVTGAWQRIAREPTPHIERGCCAKDRHAIPAWEPPRDEAELVSDNDDVQRALERGVNTPWDEPLTPAAQHGPRIDITGLPPVVRDMVAAVHADKQTPLEVVLAAALGTLAAATRGVWQVRVNDSWAEPTTALWLLTLADSGERKDAGQDPLVQPLEVADGTVAAEVRRENRNRGAERKRLMAALKEIERGEGDPRNEEHLNEQLHNARDRVAPERPFTDCTTEALGQYMSNTGGAAAVFATEAAAFQTIAGRYSDSGANVSLLNNGYDAKRYSDLRVRRAGVRIDRPTLTWCAAVQPKVLAGYADNQTEGSGFLNRFVLFLPQSMIGRHDWDRIAVVPAHVSAAWAATIGNIHAAAWARYVQMTDDLPDALGPVPVLNLESDAAEAIRQYGKNLTARQGPHTPYANLTGWMSKHPGRIVRIAALFALADNPERTTVPLWAVESALTLADPMIAHALSTYRVLRQVSQNEGGGKALDAVRSIGTDTVSTRQVYERVKGQTSWVTKTRDVHEALEYLVDTGYLRGPYKITTGKGGRPTDLWAVHPDLRTPNGDPVGGPDSWGS